MRENLEFHEKYNLDKIKHIQIKYKALKSMPRKLNVPRFKEIFHAYLLGWKIRRIIGYLQTIPNVREAIDYIKLKNDIQDSNPDDLFSKQIIERYPEMMKTFSDSYNDLIENAVWIKRPNIPTPKVKKASTLNRTMRKKPMSKAHSKPIQPKKQKSRIDTRLNSTMKKKSTPIES